MENIKKISKVMNVFFKIVFVCAVLGFLVFLVDMGKDRVALLMKNPEAESIKVSGIELGDNEFRFVSEQEVDRDFFMKKMGIDFSVEVLLFAANLFLIGIFHKLLKPMVNGQPYDGTVSRMLKKLGIACILIGAVKNVIWLLQDMSAYITLEEIKWMFAPGVVEQTVIHAGFNLGLVYVGVLILILSLVFRYGEELQIQADETL